MTSRSSPPPPPELRARVLRDAHAHAHARRALRSDVFPWRPLLAIVGVAAATRWGLALVAHAPAPPPIDAGEGAWAAVWLPLAIAASVSIALATGRRGMLGPSIERVVSMVVIATVALVASAFVGGNVTRVADVSGGGGHLSPHADFGAVVGAVLLAAALVSPADPTRPVLRGAAVGACAGAWLSAACNVACVVTSPVHVLCHHVAFVPALAAIVGLAVYLRERHLRSRIAAPVA